MIDIEIKKEEWRKAESLEELKVGMEVRCDAPGYGFDKMVGAITGIFTGTTYPVQVKSPAHTDTFALMVKEVEVRT